MGVIYKIINVVTDDFYVGSAVKPKRRKWEHWTSLKKGTHHCASLQKAWCEFGEDAFEFCILEEVPDESLLTVEDTYLATNAGQPHCYNTALSTQIPSSTQEAVRTKISAALKKMYTAHPEAHPRFGKKHTPETRAKISATKKESPVKPWLGKSRDEETRKKIGDTQRGVKKEPRVFTEDGLRRAQENMKRNAREQKPLDFGAVKAKFPSEIQAAYDFTNAVYTGALARITGCVCPVHGEFSQYAAQFRKGRGCPQCGGVQRAEAKRQQMKRAWNTEDGRTKFMGNRKKPVDTA